MKKLIMSILLAICLWSSQAMALVTYNCDYITGSAARSLDALSVSDLNNGDRAIVVAVSGTTAYYFYFKYDASGTTAENTSTHPYYVRPDDYATAGVWYEVPPGWVDWGTAVSLTNLTVSGTLTVNNVAASGKLSGGVVNTKASGTVTVSGTSLYGGHIYAANSGATVVFPTGTGAGENALVYNIGSTLESGGTVYVHFTSGDTIYCNQTITAGVSKFILSGTTLACRVYAWSPAANVWNVFTDGSPTVDWD